VFLEKSMKRAARKPALAILNTHHMGQAGKHVVEGDFTDDVLHPKRQAELETLVAGLARYRPTKVLVEVLPEKETEMNARYRAYLSGQYRLGFSEVEQIGFRLAKRLNHPRLFAVDDGNEEGAKLLQGDPFAKYQQSAAFRQILAEAEKHIRRAEEILKRHGLLALLWHLNSPEYMHEDHRFYLRGARLGVEPALWVQWWYGRNLAIFLNILRVAEKGDRLLLIIGAGHGYLLRCLAKESGELSLRDVRRYLIKPDDQKVVNPP